MSSPRILVVGSANMDLVVRTPRMPIAGETVFGNDFGTFRGGKGANQAVACARMGAETYMLGCVGTDTFGHALVVGLEGDGVDCRYVRRTEEAASGVAMIMIDDTGENSIIVAPGSNMDLTPKDILEGPDMGRFDAILLQLEVPLPVVEASVDAAREHGVLSVLDAGPPMRLPPPLLRKADVLSPNRTEALTILDQPLDSDLEGPEAADRLISAGSQSVVLKLGTEGAIVAQPDHQARVPAFRINAVDTTGAGDAFTAALAVSLARGADLVRATTVGAAAGALAATVMGATPSMPTREAVDAFLTERGA